MKSRENIIQARKFRVDESKRRIEQIEAMISDFVRMSQELMTQIEAEQSRTGITDSNHYAYSTFAKAAIERHKNLQESITGLKQQRQTALEELEEALTELRKYEKIEERDQMQEQRKILDAEQVMIDGLRLQTGQYR